MVESLTKEQVSKIPEYIDNYVKIGLKTETISKDDIENIVRDFYENILNYHELEEIKVFDSPMAAWKYISNVVGSKNEPFSWPFTMGQFDSSIFSFYDFFLNETSVDIDDSLKEKYNSWKKTMNIGAFYCFEDVCLVISSPTEVHRKNGNFHNENGMAIKWKDGFGIYALNGVKMNEKYVMTPWNQLDPKLILKEENAEVRREIVRKIGVERIIKELGAKVLDKQGDYELLSLNLGDGRNRPYLKMKNPSIGVYHIEGVSPDCTSVRDAIIFRNGTDEIPEQLT